MIGMWWWPPSENSGTSSTIGRSSLATRTWRVMIWPTTSGLLDITVRVGADEVAQPPAEALVVLPGRCWRKKSACVTMPTTRRVRSITGSALMRRCCISDQASCSGVPNSADHRVARHDVGAAHGAEAAVVGLELGLLDQRFEVVAADVEHLVVAREHRVDVGRAEARVGLRLRAARRCTCG